MILGAFDRPSLATVLFCVSCSVFPQMTPRTLTLSDEPTKICAKVLKLSAWAWKIRSLTEELGLCRASPEKNGLEAQTNPFESLQGLG